MDKTQEIIIEETFETDLRNIAVNSLNCDSKSIKDKDFFDLLIIYLNWRKRLISAKPRKVHFSKEIFENPKYFIYKNVINNILTIFERGENITPYLSKSAIKDRYSNDSIPILHKLVKNGDNIKYFEKIKRKSDNDTLLSNWEIHHLHLGNNYDKKDKYFIERTSDLLMIKVEINDVYFLNILPHQVKSWSETGLLKIIKKTGLNYVLIYNLLFLNQMEKGFL
ncbi:MAG: hypothetical protein J0H68_09940 [Sphingobacteriia bacterium]|nr:hypothetical protein [Sphingobacteriia bacterium]